MFANIREAFRSGQEGTEKTNGTHGTHGTLGTHQDHQDHQDRHRQDRQDHLPEVVKEKVVHEEIEEVQPVIEREVEQTEIQQIIVPTEEHEKRVFEHEEHGGLPTETRETRGEFSQDEMDRQRIAVQPEHVEENVGGTRVVNQPIVKENVKTRVVEEIQPVIERTIEETHVHHVEQPIIEHHVAAPIIREPIVRRPPIQSSGSY